MVLIHDILRAPEPATYQWLLHAQAPFELGNREIKWESDAGRVDVHFLKPAALTFTQKDTFDTPPHTWAFTLEEWHFTAETQKASDVMEFVTLIRIDEAKVKAIQEDLEKGTTITLAMPGRDAKIVLREDQFEIQDGLVSKVFFDADCMDTEQ